jgi:BON domain
MQLDRPIIAGVGLALGAGLMYAFDPARGRARRAHLRDKVLHAEHGLADEARTAAHDLANRSRGLAHDLATMVRPGRADDDVVRERVRARLGRAIPHPGGIEVDVRGGVVTLHGPVLAGEVGHLERELRRVRGVMGLVNRCHVHTDRGSVPALQGGREFRQLRMRPASRLLIALGIGALGLASLRRRAR